MRQLAVTVIVFALVSGAARAAVETTRDPLHATVCLVSRHVMATPTTNHVVAPKSKQTGAVGFSFALLPNLALNTGVLAFEKDAAAAQRVANEWLAFQLARYKKAHLRVTAAMVKQTYFVKDNVLVLWDNEPGTTTAGRKRASQVLQACI